MSRFLRIGKMEQKKPLVLLIEETNGIDNDGVESKDETFSNGKFPINFRHMIFALLILIGFSVTTAWYIQVSARHDNEVCFQISSTTKNAVQFGQNVLRDISAYATYMSKKNENITTKYLNEAEVMLQNQNNEWMKNVDLVLAQTNSKINSERNRLSSMTADQINNITTTIQSNIDNLLKSKPKSDIENATQVELDKLFTSINWLYKWAMDYSNTKLVENLQICLENIFKILNPELNYPYLGRNFCDQIGKQNDDIYQNFLMLNKVYSISMDVKQAILDKYVNKLCSQNQYFNNLSATIDKVIDDSDQIINLLLFSNNYFLGTLLQTKAEPYRLRMSKFLEKSYMASMNNFVQQTFQFNTTDQPLVNTESLELLKTKLTAVLQGVNDKDFRTFKSTNLHIKTLQKLEDMSEFWRMQSNKKYTQVYDKLRTQLVRTVFESNVYVASTSIRNFLPVDLCSLNFDYQQFLIAMRLQSEMEVDATDSDKYAAKTEVNLMKFPLKTPTKALTSFIEKVDAVAVIDLNVDNFNEIEKNAPTQNPSILEKSLRGLSEPKGDAREREKKTAETTVSSSQVPFLKTLTDALTSLSGRSDANGVIDLNVSNFNEIMKYGLKREPSIFDKLMKAINSYLSTSNINEIYLDIYVSEDLSSNDTILQN